MIACVGGVWADQLIHWRRYRHQWLTFPLLALVTAVFAILGLVPLMNNFAHIAGFVAGFLACSIALLNRRVSFLSVPVIHALTITVEYGQLCNQTCACCISSALTCSYCCCYLVLCAAASKKACNLVCSGSFSPKAMASMTPWQYLDSSKKPVLM